MELSPANRSALLLRFSALFGSDRSYPGWAGLNLSDQMLWREHDPEAAAIASGEVTAQHEAWLCTNQLSPEIPKIRTKQEQYQEALAEQVEKLQQWNANVSAAREQRESFQRRQMQHLNGIRG